MGQVPSALETATDANMLFALTQKVGAGIILLTTFETAVDGQRERAAVARRKVPAKQKT